MTNTALEAAGPQTEKFATPAGRYLGYVVVGAAFALALFGLISDGIDSFGLVGFCIAFSALAWVALIRPRVTAHANGLVLRNMLRDTFLPWASIRSCRAAQTLQIGTRDRVYHGLGISQSARVAAKQRRHRRIQPPLGPHTGMSAPQFAPASMTAEAPEISAAKQEWVVQDGFAQVEQRIESLAQQGAKATAGTEPKIVWDPVAIGGLLLAGLGVVFAFLI